MVSLRKGAGHLLRGGAASIKHLVRECLGLPPCSCTVAAPATGDCGCLTVDYGPLRSFGTITVNITGSSTPTAATLPACSAPGSCADVTGTYVLACGDDRDRYWRVDQFVCSSGGYDYYYANTLRITCSVGITVSISVRLGSNKVRIESGEANPYPALMEWSGPQPSGIGSVLYQHFWSETNPLRTRWAYVPSEACRDECNGPLSTTSCNVTTGSVTLTTSYISGSALTDNVCHPSSLVVSASIAAAV